ncbi:TonB-dependent receptor [bacterium]|nr:TonB-dependent receptor [bacterium]
MNKQTLGISRLAIGCIIFLLQAGSLYSAHIEGVITDLESGDSLAFVEIQVVELRRGVVAHTNGEYHFQRLPAGEFTVQASRIGYRVETKRVSLAINDVLILNFALTPDHVQIAEVTTEIRRTGSAEQLSVEFSGRKLQEQLGTTVAESFGRTPGIAVRTMGPSPARPVSRGMGGARLAILEDRQPSGDLSASSSDHAVAIDPLLAQSLRILRGPDAYHYGSSVMGGVVNIERNAMLGVEPHRATGRLLLHGNTVARGAGSSFSLAFPISRFAAHGDLSLKRAGDQRTPEGILNNTQSEIVSGSIGISLIDDWGFVGGAYSLFHTIYGLPGGFLGAHPQGVSLDLVRDVFQTRGAWHVKSNLIASLETSYSFSLVHQQEFESSGALGVEFGLLIDQFGVDAKFRPQAGFKNIRLSSSLALRDYETAAFSFTPDSRQIESGIALSAGRQMEKWEFSAAIRGDFSRVDPDVIDTSRVIGIVKPRKFSGLSGAVRLDRPLDSHWAVGAQISRSFRTPQIEELYSEGPHLAAYSYEFGNTTLPAEIGWGGEANLFRKSDVNQLTLSAYANRFSSFIFPQAAGRPSPVRNDLELYQYMASDALIYGADMSVEFSLTPSEILQGQISYVHGSILGGSNLPAIPPLNFSVSFTKMLHEWNFTPELTGAAPQRELGEFETSTAGYLISNFKLSRYWTVSKTLFVLTAAVDNIFDSSYRNHLSRVKTVLPEPGRNFGANVSVQF